MNSEQRATFRAQYQAGLAAFEGGQYRQSIEYLEQACELCPSRSRAGGEAQLWLVNAYQAADRWDAAIDLCQQLQHHPYPTISRQAKDLLYILQAPRLQRSPDWLTQIPDLARLEDRPAQACYLDSKATPPPETRLSVEQFPVPSGESEDNRAFVGFAVVVAIALLGGLWWLG